MKLLFSTAMAVLLGTAAYAQAATTLTITIPVVVQANLTISVSPPSPTIACAAAAGTVVATFTAAGGDGNAVTYTVPAGDFAISGSTLIVGTSGIASAHCGTTESVVVTATQP